MIKMTIIVSETKIITMLAKKWYNMQMPSKRYHTNYLRNITESIRIILPDTYIRSIGFLYNNKILKKSFLFLLIIS